MIEHILGKRGYESPCLLGRGAFAEVYRVKRKCNGKFYACKISVDKGMLWHEAEILAELEHPLFPKFYEVWQEEQWGFLVMEYVPGISLERLLERRGKLSEAQAAGIATELAAGFVCLHERHSPILYRDLKPHNIQIRADGCVKLLDFGCACHLREAEEAEGYVRVGTCGFAAPEQLAGKIRAGILARDAGKAGDIYAFGRVLQCMAPEKKAAWRRKKQPLLRLAEACTARKPEDRPASFRLCLYELMGCLQKGFWEKCSVKKYIFDI